MPREKAIRTYAVSLNRWDTAFANLASLPEKLDLMRRLLHDPITSDEAFALTDIVYRRRDYEDMAAWLQDEPISWDGHFARQEYRAEEAYLKHLEVLRKEAEDEANGIVRHDPDSPFSPEQTAIFKEQRFASAKAAHLPKSRPCPQCGTPPDLLEWTMRSSESPSGFFMDYLITRCRFCLRQVDFFGLLMGRTRRGMRMPAGLRQKRLLM
jgi:hypothetical protein